MTADSNGLQARQAAGHLPSAGESTDSRPMRHDCHSANGAKVPRSWRRVPSRHRGFILPVVIFMLVLIGLLAATFTFRVHADLAAVQAQSTLMQTRLAAEAGVERVKLLLRDSRFDVAKWYHNPDEFHRIIVWSEGGDPTVWGKNDELDEGTAAFRFSIVADDPTDDEHFIRIGITDEAAKLNLNTATKEQLFALVSQITAGDEEVDPQLLVDAIVDWKDSDREPIGTETDTEGEYYESLEPPYRVKNAAFDTVEELLLVKGITPAILYGEDFDRNGLLTPNEDDGERSYPMDNQDGRLNRGLFPYVTVVSAENNVSNDQRPRVSLRADTATIRAQLEADFPNDPDVLEFLATTARGQVARRGSGSGKQGQPRQPGSQPGKGQTDQPLVPGRRGQQETPQGDIDLSGIPGLEGVPIPSKGDKPGSKKQRERAQSTGETKPGAGNAPASDRPDETAETGETTGTKGGTKGNGPKGQQGQEGASGGQPQEGGENPGKGGDTGDVSPPQRTIVSPASLFFVGEPGQDGRPGVANPLKGRTDLLPTLMDRVTIAPPNTQKNSGLININTAPAIVLKCIDGLSDADIEAIVTKRGTLEPEQRLTTAWLVTEEAVSLETFDKIAAQITARGQQFTIESLGYGDHVGAVTRLQVVVDMLGPIAQTVYYRDITYIGGHYPIREADKERIGVR